MSNCDCVNGGVPATQGCGCVVYDAATGVLTVNDEVVMLGGGGAATPIPPDASGIAAGALNPAVTVDGSQITGTLPDAAIPCTAVIACLAAAPADSIAPAAIGPGALDTDVTIDGSQVTGTLPAAAIPCPAVIACLTPGSVPVSALAPGALPTGVTVDPANISPVGTTGQVLTSDGTNAVWAAPTGGGGGGPVDPTTGITAGALNTGVTVDGAQITGVLPASAIPCPAVLACITPGSLAPGSLAGGTNGQVLTTDASGNAVWAAAPTGGGGGPVDPNTGISAGTLNPAVTVAGSQITGVLPDAAIPCTAVHSCLSTAPAGAMPATAIAGGTAGQVLITDGSGNAVWGNSPAPVAAMQAATAVVSPNGVGMENVWGDDGTAARSGTPPQVVEAAHRIAPASTNTNRVSGLVGVDATGNAVTADVVEVGTQTVGTGGTAAQTLNSNGNFVLASVTVPAGGLYAIDIYTLLSYAVSAGGTGPATGSDQNHWKYTTTIEVGGAIIFHNGSQSVVNVLPGEVYPAGFILPEAHWIGQQAIRKFNGGETVEVKFYNTSSVSNAAMATTVATPLVAPTITLTKLSDYDVVPG